jgi:Fe-S oxidoreductase
MSDLIEMTRLCSVCYKMCRDMCSVAGATRHEADSPHNRAFFAHDVMNGKKELTPEIADYFYRCSLCKACREACETNQDTGEVMFSSRKELDPEILPKTIKDAREKIISQRPYGDESKVVRELISSIRQPDEEHPLFIFGAKMRAGSAHGVTQISATISLMNKLGAEFSVMEEEPVTGQLPYFLGFTHEGKDLSEEFMRRISSLEAKKLVLLSADDLRMVKVAYPDLGIDIADLDVMSFPEFLLSLVQQKNPSFIDTGGITITYHDPCGLGRELRIFEAPREIIRSIPGSKLIELPLTRDQAPCCGYGVGLSFSHPEITRLMAHRLATMASDTGADMMVTGCPTCRDIILENITEAESTERSTELLDLTLLLDRMIQ